MIRTLGEIGSSIVCENGLSCSECVDFVAVNQSSGSAQSINGGRIMQLNVEESNVMTILHDKVTAVDTLAPDQKSALLEVLHKNRAIFSHRLGKCTSYLHSFEVVDQTPFNHKSRTIPSMLVEKTNATIQDMLSQGVIEPSHSQYINPLCIVVKADGNVRLTIDARTLNKRCKSDHFRNENIEPLLDRINGARYYSTIDLSSSFWQVELAPQCRDYTAFLHKGKQYKFKRVPFGLSSSTAALLRALDNIFQGEICRYASCFVDDVCIFDDEFETHLRHVDHVISKLREHGFTVKPEKTHFFKREVEFLGFIISDAGLRPNPKKVESIMDLPPPKNLKQLRRFLGIC